MDIIFDDLTLRKNSEISRREMRHIITISRLSWVVEFEANCPLMEPGSIGGMLFVWVFLKDPSPYLREFRGKPRKTPNG